MRRNERALTEEQSVELLNRCEYGVLSLVTPENTPYSVPVNYVYKNTEKAVYIHCAKEGRKLMCIEKNDGASFTVVGYNEVIDGRFTTAYESAMVFGKASLVENKEEKVRILIELCKKYYTDTESNLDKFANTIKYIDKLLSKTAIIKISVDEISGKANK